MIEIWGVPKKKGVPKSWMVWNMENPLRKWSKVLPGLHPHSHWCGFRTPNCAWRQGNVQAGCKRIVRLTLLISVDVRWFQGILMGFPWISYENYIWIRWWPFLVFLFMSRLCKKSSRRMDPLRRSDHTLRPLGKTWTSFKGWENLLEEEYGNRSVGKHFFWEHDVFAWWEHDDDWGFLNHGMEWGKLCAPCQLQEFPQETLQLEDRSGHFWLRLLTLSRPQLKWVCLGDTPTYGHWNMGKWFYFLGRLGYPILRYHHFIRRVCRLNPSWLVVSNIFFVFPQKKWDKSFPTDELHHFSEG